MGKHGHARSAWIFGATMRRFIELLRSLVIIIIIITLMVKRWCDVYVEDHEKNAEGDWEVVRDDAV